MEDHVSASNVPTSFAQNVSLLIHCILLKTVTKMGLHPVLMAPYTICLSYLGFSTISKIFFSGIHELEKRDMETGKKDL